MLYEYVFLLLISIFRTPTIYDIYLEQNKTNQYSIVIASASKEYNINPYVVHSLIWAESRFDPIVKSKKTSARGIAQITHSGVAAIRQLQQQRNAPILFSYSRTLNPTESIFAATELLDYGIKRCGEITKAIGLYNTGKCKKSRWAKSVISLSNNIE